MAGRKGKTNWIFSDSQAAPRAIGEIHTCSKLVMETKASLTELGKDNLLNLIWIPGHSGSKGIQKADVLAKQGDYTQGPSRWIAGISVQEVRTQIAVHGDDMLRAISQARLRPCGVTLAVRGEMSYFP